MKKIISRIIDIVLILLIIYLAFRLLQKKGIIETKIDKMDRIPSFTVEDMEGNTVSDEVFEDYDFTIVNIWSPLCGACFEALESLEELEAYIESNNGNIIGMVTNGSKAMAEKKLDELNISFTNLIPDKKLNKELVKDAMVTPTIIFVDSSGSFLDMYTGSYNKDEEVRRIKRKIDELKK